METQTNETEKTTYIKSILQNDEVSTDKELINLFMGELNITEKEAVFYVSQRDKALNIIEFDLKPFVTNETQTEKITQEEQVKMICKCGHNKLYHEKNGCIGMMCNCKEFKLKQRGKD